ncbi:MAG: DMT family transporter [Chrysiogenetes bacterium]|nr:DMT family transporter [Chrysiogenetes bacterium]
MPEFTGFGFGLLTALFWGLTDFTAKRSVEDVDPLAVTVGMQLVGAVFLGLIGLIVWLVAPGALEFWMQPAGEPFGYWWLMSMLVGVSAISGVMFAFRSFSRAPLSVASPIVNTKGMFAAILAILFLGDVPGVLMALGALFCVSGAVMIGYENKEEAARDGTHFLQPGVGSALMGAAGYGAAMAFTQPVVHHGGYGMGLFGLRLGASLLLIPVAVWQLGWRNILPPRHAWGKVAAVGLLDAGGHVCVLLGYGLGSSVMVSSLTSIAPAITLILAFVVLKEHLSRRQWFALGLVGAGIGFLSV